MSIAFGALYRARRLERCAPFIDNGGPGIDNQPVARIAILTASDQGAAGSRVDLSGDTAASRASAAGHEVTRRAIVADDRAVIASTLAAWCDDGVADIVITTGGTGLTARDVTPEATRDIAERDVPGIPLALVLSGLGKTPYAVLSRGVAVTRGRTLVVNLPGHPKAVEEGMDVLLPLIGHIATLLSGSFEHRTPADTGHASGAANVSERIARSPAKPVSDIASPRLTALRPTIQDPESTVR